MGVTGKGVGRGKLYEGGSVFTKGEKGNLDPKERRKKYSPFFSEGGVGGIETG